jgi:hypothetical protein
MCNWCCDDVFSPTTVSPPTPPTPPLLHTSSPSVSPSIKKSPSQRFPHISHDIMKIIAPHIEMPEINNETDRVAYRAMQDKIINKLMRFLEEK